VEGNAPYQSKYVIHISTCASIFLEEYFCYEIVKWTHILLRGPVSKHMTFSIGPPSQHCKYTEVSPPTAVMYRIAAAFSRRQLYLLE